MSEPGNDTSKDNGDDARQASTAPSDPRDTEHPAGDEQASQNADNESPG